MHRLVWIYHLCLSKIVIFFFNDNKNFLLMKSGILAGKIEVEFTLFDGRFSLHTETVFRRKEKIAVRILEEIVQAWRLW